MFCSDESWTLVTGATKGVGYEMARALSITGKNLILVDADENQLCRVARELNEISDIIIMPVDLSKPGSTNELFGECDRLGLRISMLFNFA